MKPSNIKITRPMKLQRFFERETNQENYSLLSRLVDINERQNRSLLHINPKKKKMINSIPRKKKLHQISKENKILLNKILGV